MKRTLIIAIAALSSGAFAQYNVAFDSMTSANGTIYSFTPGTGAHCFLEGQAMTLAAGTANISGMDFDMISKATVNYSDVQVKVAFYGGFTGGYANATAAFSNLLGSVTVDLGAQSLGTGFYYTFQGSGGAPAVSWAPIQLATAGQVGVQFLFLGNSGTGLAPTDNLQMGMNLTAAPTVGANPAQFQVLYQDKSQASPVDANTSLLENDYLYFGNANENFATRFYSTPVPEPASMAVLGIGALALLRRKKSA